MTARSFFDAVLSAVRAGALDLARVVMAPESPSRSLFFSKKKLPRTFFDLVFFVARSGLVLWIKIHLTAKGLSICDKFTSAITGANFVC